MPAPQISAEDVARISQDLQNAQFLAQGGQKTVFSCEIEGEPLVIKFLLVEESASGNGQSATQVADRLSEITSRAGVPPFLVPPTMRDFPLSPLVA